MKMILPRVLLVFLGWMMGQGLRAQTDVLTQHNDLGRTGWNQTETQLNVGNVSDTQFGLLFKQPVDDQIYSQPLLVSGVNIAGSSKNVVYVATTNNSIYAFDGDNGSVGQYWQISLTPSGMRPPNSNDVHSQICGTYSDFTSQFGIVGTPVIDKASNTLFVVSRYADPSMVDASDHGNGDAGYLPTGFHQVLYAIDLSDGHTIMSTEISASVPGTAPGSSGGMIQFDPLRENQRGGLLLLNGVIYIPYAAHCDWDNYHGWLFAYDEKTLNQLTAFISTPNDGRGGIWMSGAAAAGETAGNGSIYLASGNSNSGDPSILQNRGESIVKLVPNQPGASQTSLTIADWFTPTDYSTLNNGDLDFGSQVMIVPGSNMLVTGCKDSYMYVMDKTNLGGYNTTANAILQKYLIGTNAGFHSSLAYFGGSSKAFVYQFADNQILSAYPVIPGTPGSIDFADQINGSVVGGKGQCGSYMSVSSNGNDITTGILWIANAANYCNANQGTCPGVLYAVNASDVSKTLWTSSDNPGDVVGNFAKTACPTIANGKVYLATFSKTLNVYGLLSSNPRCVNNVALNKTAVASSNSGSAGNAFDGNTGTTWTSDASDPQYIYVDLGAEYDLCQVSITWAANSFAQNFDLDVTDVDPVANPNSWVNVTHVTGNASATTSFAGGFSGRYVRMNGLSRANNANGYGIVEMQVLGQLSTTCAVPTGLANSLITQNTAHIAWNAVPGATGYNFAYQNSNISSWISRNNLTTNSIDLSALSCSAGYSYTVTSICSSGATSTAAPGSFNTTACTAPCGSLPTRWAHADIGDIGIAGTSCWLNNVYTIQGSGTNIGGMDDQFQYAYTGQDGDLTYSTRVASQDATNPDNKAGIMFKQSLSNTAPFAFVGITSGLGAVFVYRSVDGAAATAVYLAGPTAPYYVELVKTGTQYAAYVSATGNAGDWQQIGTTQNLNFGTTTWQLGLAVTSADNTKLSTSVFDNQSNSSILPITLVSFTAQNINDQYISLHWTTANEENNDHFTLERSSDGVNFELIATVKAVGNSSVNQNYSYSDSHPVNGLNFYRLKQYDIDGRMAVFPVVQVTFGLNALPVVFPNPATQNVHIVSGNELVRSVRLMSIDGKEIMKSENQAGLQEITLNVASLSTGVYMLEYKTDSKTFQQKIIKQ
jgi:hypothetical protein